jgi:hypothetical protein
LRKKKSESFTYWDREILYNDPDIEEDTFTNQIGFKCEWLNYGKILQIPSRDEKQNMNNFNGIYD